MSNVSSVRGVIVSLDGLVVIHYAANHRGVSRHASGLVSTSRRWEGDRPRSPGVVSASASLTVFLWV